MNRNNNNIHQCSQCKKDFPEQDVYRIGIKKKEFFCRECAKNIKSECMWCSKELEQQIQELKKQQKNSSSFENPTKSKAITYSIIGFLIVFLVGCAILLAKSNQKNTKIK